MIVVAVKSFNQEIAQITNRTLARKVETVLRKLESANNISQIGSLKKLEGAANAFRIRVGDYRIGFFLEGNTIRLMIFAHRKEIYRYFP